MRLIWIIFLFGVLYLSNSALAGNHTIAAPQWDSDQKQVLLNDFLEVQIPSSTDQSIQMSLF